MIEIPLSRREKPSRAGKSADNSSRSHRRKNENCPMATAARRDAQLLLSRCGMKANQYARIRFLDVTGENRVHFSYARDKTTDQAAPDCPRGTQCLNVRIAAAIGEPGPAKRAVATGCSTPSVLNARQRTLSQSLHGIDKADNGSVEAAS